jgi:hypothetical protein
MNTHEPVWITPQLWHTAAHPFCKFDACACHFDHDRVERYIVQPIERGDINIPQGLARYYNREVPSAMYTTTPGTPTPAHIVLRNELINPHINAETLSTTLFDLELPVLAEADKDPDATEKRAVVQVYVDHACIPAISPLLLEREREALV